jgi:peptide/nickel transport system permease protein
LSGGPARLALARALRAPGARLALLVLFALGIAAVAAPLLARQDPAAQPDIVREQYLPPSAAHPFGTDAYSRDVYSRVLYGARVSLGVAFASVALAMTLGMLVGAVAGLAGGWIDPLLMRLVDALLAVPRLLLVLSLIATLGTLSPGGIVLLLGGTGWPAMSRIVRGEVRAIRAREFVLAARATGVPEWRLLIRHIVPAALPQVLVAGTLALATVIPLEAGLSFLGLGVQPPTASWGNIILEGADRPAATWWLLLFPGLAIIATVLAANALGERLRDAIDPRQLPTR